MEKDFKKKVIKPLCIYSLAFSMLLPSVASLADLDINLGGYSVVYAAAVKPTVNKISIGDKTVSGKLTMGAGQRKSKKLDFTIHVRVERKAGGTEEKSVTVAHTEKNQNWTISLDSELLEGDKVTVTQEYGGETSPEVINVVKPTLNIINKEKLKMPTGDIWIEQYVANIVNTDENTEAFDLLKKANPDIANDIKSVEFKITGETTKSASYIVTYTDDSKSVEIQAPDLTVNKVTEYSRGTKIDDITIVDNVIKGKLKGEGPFTDIKVQIVVKLSDAGKGSFCNEKGCTVDKTSSNPVDATVDGTTGEFSYTIDPNNPIEKIELGNVVGVTVKEPHKFVSCSTTTVKPVKVEKQKVKDPRKLTAKDKEAIDAAIRSAYTVNGESKLPNGSELEGGVPAVIQFDDSGNVKIFSGGDVKGNWDDNYKFVPEKNADGSYKLNDGAEPKITIPAKDLLKNIKPEAPAVALSKDKKNITITPNKVDTDAMKITVNYEDPKGNKKEAVAVKKVDNSGTEPKTTWEVEKGDITVGENGVITLPKDKVKGGTDVTATVTDKGGIADDDKDPLISDPGTLTVEETIADKVEALGGLDPVDIKKWVGDKVEWKDGVKAKDSKNEAKVNELLNEAKTSISDEDSRGTTKEGDFTGKIKVTFDDGSFIEVENQNLYVSNYVTSVKRKDKVPTDALDVEFKLGEGTKVDNTDGTEIKGNKDNPVSYQKYMVKPQTNLKECKNETLKETYYNLINSKLKAIDKYTEPVWNGENGSVTENFIITDSNKVFTATATKTYDITFDANTGGGTKDKVTQKVNTEYELPAKDTFTPPNENQEFSGWQVGEDTTLKQPGAKIPITGDTTVKAIWKPIEFKATFQTEAGASGKMEEQTVSKGSKYELPKPTFTPEEGKEFAGWKVPGEAKVKKAGDEIDISGDVTLIATWKDIMVNVSYNANGGSGTMTGKELAKGSKYTLLDNAFKAPNENQEFKAWEVNGKEVAAGTEITADKDTVIKAIWKEKTTTDPSQPGGGTTPGENPEKPNPSQPANPTDTPPTVNENPDGSTNVTPGPGTGKVVIPTTGKNGENPIDVVVEQDDKGKWENKNNVPGVTVDPDTGKTTIPADRKVDKDHIISESKPKVKPEEPSYEENEIPGIKIRDHYTPTFPVYVTVPKTEKVEKAEEVPVSLETHKAYIAGYEDNTLRAEGNLTRAEAAAMVTRLAGLGLSDNSMPAFKDMQKNAWYFRYINAAVKAKMLDADNGIMRPNDKITRAEFAKMLAAIDKENSSVSKFDDIKGHRYEKEINKIYGNNRIEGYEDGSFRPDAYLTRAESAAFLNRMFNRIADKEAYAGLEDKLAKFKDFDASKWYYDEMVEATNSHELSRRGKASDKFGRVYEKWTRILPSDVK
ncbi:S-layer homology domain-containing protein [Peptoniphilus harei]|uniref:S-layer homology domain-containing protein n=1 Tax=Peptoniphilus harei TaxID=54005 RepID=UPI0011DD30CB|nr:S-layer homology domain-containing protein [Peptoniphilus harei]